MQSDLTGPAAAPATDTATAPSDALSTPEPTDESSAAAERPGAGDEDGSSPTPDDDDASSEEESGDETDDDAEADQPEGERKPSRKERQRQREEARIAQAVTDAIAKRDAEAAAAADAKAKQEQALAAFRASQERFVKFLGEPDSPEKPGTLRRLDGEINGLQSEINSIQELINSELRNPQGADLDALLAQQAAKKSDQAAKQSEKERYEGYHQFRDLAQDDAWETFKDQFLSAALFPEFGNDPAKQAKYFHAPGGVAGGLAVLADTIRQAKDAEWAPKLAAVEKKAAAELAAQKEQTKSWRVRAGGAEMEDTTGGTASTNGGVLTLDRYRSMSTEERLDLTPKQRDDMMARHQRERAASR